MKDGRRKASRSANIKSNITRDRLREGKKTGRDEKKERSVSRFQIHGDDAFAKSALAQRATFFERFRNLGANVPRNRQGERRFDGTARFANICGSPSSSHSFPYILEVFSPKLLFLQISSPCASCETCSRALIEDEGFPPNAKLRTFTFSA